MAAWDGGEIVIAVEGRFASPPAGATMASAAIALFGSEAKVAAAAAQYRSGETGAAQLLAQAPRDRAVWAVVRGDIDLPLRGNAANFNRLLHATEFTAIAVTPGAPARLEATGVCRTAEDAVRLRDTAGGMFLLAGLSNAKVTVEDRSVRVAIEVPEAALARFFDSFYSKR
jgi:hypothetical protein